MPSAIRPTKKQQEMLIFINTFINEHGYSPSYREIMSGCNYTSIATVALHVRSLIARGHLIKRGRSARSLEVVMVEIETPQAYIETKVEAGQEKWLMDIITSRFKIAEQAKQPTQKEIDELYVLVGSLKVLGLPEAANSFLPRLKNLTSKKIKKVD